MVGITRPKCLSTGTTKIQSRAQNKEDSPGVTESLVSVTPEVIQLSTSFKGSYPAATKAASYVNAPSIRFSKNVVITLKYAKMFNIYHEMKYAKPCLIDCFLLLPRDFVVFLKSLSGFNTRSTCLQDENRFWLNSLDGVILVLLGLLKRFGNDSKDPKIYCTVMLLLIYTQDFKTLISKSFKSDVKRLKHGFTPLEACCGHWCHQNTVSVNYTYICSRKTFWNVPKSVHEEKILRYSFCWKYICQTECSSYKSNGVSGKIICRVQLRSLLLTNALYEFQCISFIWNH